MWCELGFDSVFVVTSTQGLQIFDADAYHCIFTHPCKDTSAVQGGTFSRGIANIFSNYICVGNSGGCLRVFGAIDETSEVTFIDRKAVHQSAITDISCCDQYLASADSNGDIFYWEFTDEQLISLSQIKSYGFCCINIKLTSDWLVAGYGSGHIRLFDLKKTSRDSTQFSLLVEIAAHAKWISGLDVSLNLQYILTVSEDSFAKVWAIEKRNDFYVRILFSVIILLLLCLTETMLIFNRIEA
ncbi:unnamed protein product [Bemisia tabaci]|uniref:WD repeat-containing protein 54 beta-propeller domain-containing protein n=1 Tax=Bemisia tabaci TaxID=7038 RepID=A0A9P0G292_BEMTA|nr:unnamed protein product [Bemisia tabaci]